MTWFKYRIESNNSTPSDIMKDLFYQNNVLLEKAAKSFQLVVPSALIL